jgi:hypothetical protein
MAENRHPGINMHKLPVGGGFIGILFAIGSAVIFIVGFPTLWYFVALAFAFGIAIAVVLKIASHRLSDRGKPLSILTVDDKSVRPTPAREKNNGNLFHAAPSPFTA